MGMDVHGVNTSSSRHFSIQIVSLLSLALVVSACQAKSDEMATPSKDQAEAQVAAKQDHHDDEHDHDHDEEKEDFDQLRQQAQSDAPMDKKLGQPLSDDVERLEVTTLLNEPTKYQGKKVQVTGKVKDMCYHRGGWFGIDTGDGSKVLRVIGAPNFSTPKQALNATAVAQGVVEVRTIPADRLNHYKQAHKFISKEELAAAEADGRPVEQAVLVATGAHFSR